MAEHPHPFPAHIVQAVAKAIYASEFRDPEIGAYSWEENLTGEERTDYMSGAQYVLTALWDASRVDDYAQLEQLPDNAILKMSDGRAEYARTLRHIYREDVYPLHIIWHGGEWGGHP